MTFNVFEMGIEESVQRAFDVLRDGGIVIEAIYELPWSKCCATVINKYSVAQPDSHDIYKIPTAKFLRIRMSDETARVLGHEPWEGGIPPYQWIGEQIAPKLGYTYGNDTLPIVEYYVFFKPEDGTHKYCYLYVPVKENNDIA